MTAKAFSRAQPDVIVAHDFCETYGGAERIVAEIATALDPSQFWAIMGRRSVADRMGVGERFHAVLPERDRLLRHYRLGAPAYPALVRAKKLPATDVLVSSSYGFAHGFETINRAPQLCYCYSPLRFAWSMTEAYGAERGGTLTQAAFRAFAAFMRRSDLKSARRVTGFVAESAFVANQIERFYGVESRIVFPPVDCSRFTPAQDGAHDDYFLFCGRLVEPYKRPFMTVEAFRGLPHRLLVAGDGPALEELRRVAPPNVEFAGHLEDEALVEAMQRCKAAVFPSRDDFGLIPVEVMACGRPVIAFAGGGALETVVAGQTGEFFNEQTAEALREAIVSFDDSAYDPGRIREHAQGWDVPRFRDEIAREVRSLAG